MNILTSIHGRLAGLDSFKRFLVPAGYVSGDHGSQFILPNPNSVVLFDDFLGDVLADEWNYVEGTDTGTADGAISAAANGILRLTSGDSTGTVAADGAELNSELNWKANQGKLTFQTRLTLSAITNVSVFVGFTDTKSLEAPIQSADSANTLTSNATDAVGFMFDTDMTDDNWWLTGVADDTDATAEDTGIAPVATTFETLRVELDASGNARFFRNGIQVGSLMSSAVTATVALTPVAIVWPLTTTSVNLDLDYVYVSADRA